MRWQRFMILVTLVLSTLLTSIWFYCAFPRLVAMHNWRGGRITP